MNTFEITIKEGQEGRWPVETELTRTHDRLPIHHQGTLKLSKEDIKQLNLTGLNIQRQKYGELLGKALFQNGIRDAYLQAIDSSLEGGIRLLLTVEDLELQALYWHWLCAPPRDYSRDWNSISRNQRCCFSIGLKSSTDRVFPQIKPQDLKALILVASPQNLEKEYSLAPFNVEETVNYLKTALGEIPTDVLTVDGGLGMPTVDGLCDRLTQSSYNLLHIVSHGKLNQGETYLYWATENNQVEVVKGSYLIQRLGNIAQLPHFIFLSACESAKTEAGMALGGLAQRMVGELGIPAVLAMTESVTIETAALLSKAFYPRLRKHGEVDKALVEATSSLSRHDILVPALFSRLGNRSLYRTTTGIAQFISREQAVKLVRVGILAASALLTAGIGFQANSPRIAAWFNHRGEKHYYARKLQSALSNYQNAIVLNPNYPRAYYNLGLVYDDWEQYDKAKQQYQLAIESDPDSSEPFVQLNAYNNLGRLYILKKNYTTALSKLNKALTLITTVQLQTEKELERLEKTRYSLFKNLGWVQLEMEIYVEAEAFLREAIPLAPERAPAYCLLAQVLEGTQKPEAAKTHWEYCLIYADPGLPDERLWLALARQKIAQEQQP